MIHPQKLEKEWGDRDQESDNFVDEAKRKYIYSVAYAVNRVCTKTKWESKCLVRALTARTLLKSKGIETTLYLGCAYKENKLVAHAWLRTGDIYVSGGNGKEYAIVSKFKM